MNYEMVFGSDGFAGLTRLGVSQVLGVSYSTVTEAVRSGGLFAPEEVGSIDKHGVRGEELKKLCAYFQCRKVRGGAKQRCKELLATVQDFQSLINGLAGNKEEESAVETQSIEQLQQPEQLTLLVDEELPPDEDGSVDIITRKVDGFLVGQRDTDGYINATAISSAHKQKTGQRRDVSEWLATKRTQETLSHLSTVTGIPVTELCQVIQGGSIQGTWIHPRLAVRFAIWVSDEFGYMVERWVEQWTVNSVSITTQPQQPALPPKPTAQERLNIIERSIGLLDLLGGLDDRTKLALNDSIRNIAFEDRLAITSGHNERLEWPISDRVAHLGYGKQDRETLKSIGTVASRLYVQRHGCKPPKREQFVDGTTRPVNCYGSADVDLLDKAIYSELGEPPNKVLRLPPPASR